MCRKADGLAIPTGWWTRSVRGIRAHGQPRYRFKRVAASGLGQGRGRPRALPLIKKAFVIVVRSNPEPNNRISVPHANRSVVTGDAHGVDRLISVHLLEAKTGMTWILREQLVRFSSPTLDVLGQVGVRVPKARRDVGGHNRSESSSSVAPDWCSCNASCAN